MKRDFNVKERDAAAKKIYDRILKKRKAAPIPDTTTVEKCSKCSEGKVLIDLSNEPDWKYTLDGSVCMNVGGHTLLFTCSECGSHITKRGIGTCKSDYPKYKKP